MLNVIALMGRLVADPELRHTPNGIATCTFRIAVDRNFVRAGEERKADFIDIVAWRQSAEFVCKYFHKGNLIAVNGSLQTRNYEDKNGNKRTRMKWWRTTSTLPRARAAAAAARAATRARCRMRLRPASRARRARELCGRQRRRFRRDRRQRRSYRF
ncbi:MAG: single-stranded DNA-binding protein [Ruthenibacterium lactatiformans]